MLMDEEIQMLVSSSTTFPLVTASFPLVPITATTNWKWFLFYSIRNACMHALFPQARCN